MKAEAVFNEAATKATTRSRPTEQTQATFSQDRHASNDVRDQTTAIQKIMFANYSQQESGEDK